MSKHTPGPWHVNMVEDADEADELRAADALYAREKSRDDWSNLHPEERREALRDLLSPVQL